MTNRGVLLSLLAFPFFYSLAWAEKPTKIGTCQLSLVGDIAPTSDDAILKSAELFAQRKSIHSKACKSGADQRDILPACKECEKQIHRAYVQLQHHLSKKLLLPEESLNSPLACAPDLQRNDSFKLLEDIKTILSKEGPPSFDIEKFTSFEPTIVIDQMVNQCVTEPTHLKQMVQRICKFPKNALDSSKPILDQLLFPASNLESPDPIGKNCLENISKLIDEDPEKNDAFKPVYDFLEQCNPRLGKLRNHPDLSHSMIHSFTKHSRALITKNYLDHNINQYLSQFALDHASPKKASQLKKILEDSIVVDGFNRFFSPMNNGGAGFASDADIKAVVDCERVAKAFQTSTVSRLRGLWSKTNRQDDCNKVKEVIANALDQTKNDLARFGINMERHPKSVTTVEEIVNDIQKSKAEKQYWATRPANSQRLCGSSKLSEKIEELVTKNLGKDRYSLRYEQLLGKSDKGSIEVIREMGKENPDVLNDKVKKSFSKNYIGKYPADNDAYSYIKKEKTSDPWIFSTKYALMRLFDYDSHHPLAISLNNKGLRLQNLIYDYHKYKKGVVDPEKLDEVYSRITADEFVEIALLQPDSYYRKELFSVIGNWCGSTAGIAYSVDPCKEFERIKNVPIGQKASDGLVVSEKTWHDFGTQYFSSVFDCSYDLGQVMKEKAMSKSRLSIPGSPGRRRSGAF